MRKEVIFSVDIPDDLPQAKRWQFEHNLGLAAQQASQQIEKLQPGVKAALRVRTPISRPYDLATKLEGKGLHPYVGDAMKTLLDNAAQEGQYDPEVVVTLIARAIKDAQDA